MNKFRIKSETVKIEVNDNGEYIELPFGDQAFPKRVFDLIDGFQVKQKELENESIEDITAGEAVQKNLDIHVFFKSEIDKVFGAETCRKVFGDIIPSIDALAQFFEEIEPYFEEYQKERIEKVNKYSAGRVGNV